MNQAFIIFLFLISMGYCNAQVDFPKLESSDVISRHFSAQEINELQKILDFFDSELCEKSSKDLAECYESFFSKVLKESETGDVYVKFPYSEQTELYRELDTAMFNEIWAYGKTWTHDVGDTLKYMDLNTQGSFQLLLKDIAKYNEGIKYYHEALLAVHGISPSMVGNIAYNASNYDISKSEIRLIIAIHYITLYDPFFRKEPY
jgi:hypothetical protein